jgi:hypothetical protein
MSDNKPTISVCIPVYNRRETVRRALESVLTQTWHDFEIVAVDNASPDGTFETLAEYSKRDPRVHAYRNNTNVGAVRNWMKCVEYSRGELIKIVFSDDWLLPGAIEAFVLALQGSPKSAFATCAGGMHIEGSHYPDVFWKGTSGEIPKEEFIWEHATSGETLLVTPMAAVFRRKDLLTAIQPGMPGPDCEYCNSHAMGHDLAIFLRTIDKYPCYYHIDRKLIMLSHSNEEESISKAANISGESARKFACYRAALGKCLEESSLSEWQKARFRAAMYLRDINPRSLRSAASRKALKERIGPFDLPVLAAFVTPSVFRFAMHRLTEIAGSLLRKAGRVNRAGSR